MNRFKKRTIALVLASVVTVVGSFGADNYKNSLMGLKFESSSAGNVNMVVQTKTTYSGNVTPIKKDANTYILMLPEMNSLAQTPNLENSGGNIVSVNIRTMPYSNTAKGYTRITIKTASQSFNLVGQNQIYIPSQEVEKKQIPLQQSQTTIKKENPSSDSYAREKRRQEILAQRTEARRKELEAQKKTQLQTREKELDKTETVKRTLSVGSGDSVSSGNKDRKKIKRRVSHGSNIYLWLLALLIVLSSAYFYVKAKNKMQELAGESIDIEIKEDLKNSPTRKSLKQIKNTINTLDETYSKSSLMVNNSEYTFEKKSENRTIEKDESQIVDLDELFKEHKIKNNNETKEQEENDALEEFLSGFSFMDSEDLSEVKEKEELYSYDSDLYDEILSRQDLKFSSSDFVCIRELLANEIQDETIKNIKEYAVSNPIKSEDSKEKILEDLILSYSITQKIVFTDNDVKSLRSLINVELDDDFVTDLRTNPVRVAEARQEIISSLDKPKKTAEIISLKVKDVLPDLSVALQEQKGKTIESNHRAETIFFSEGYDVKTLTIKDNLPDLTLELNKKENYKQKPSATYDIVDKSYVVGSGELKISSELPDLQDVMANPEKYEKAKPKELKVDEDSLLNNLLNAEFKPFYDGTNEFEVLNKIEEIPTISDINEEVKELVNFEVKNAELVEENIILEERNDFSSLYNNNVVGLNTSDLEEENYVEFEDKIEPIKTESLQERQTNTASDLLMKIELTKMERENRKRRLEGKSFSKNKTDINKSIDSNKNIKCMLDGESLTIVSSVKMTEDKGCHLAKKSDGYVILGYVADKFFQIKTFEGLKSEKIQARQSEILSNGDLRFIVRIGINKFVVDVTADNINYVMDLC